jgi:hypothetical protein
VISFASRMHVWLKNEPLISCAINYPISHHINANVSIFVLSTLCDFFYLIS